MLIRYSVVRNSVILLVLFMIIINVLYSEELQGRIHPGQNSLKVASSPYVINEPKFCSDDIYILNVVVITPAQFFRRQSFRSFWKSSNIAKDLKTKVLFFMGSTEISHAQTSINRESRLNGDIIQINLPDVYANLVHKSIAILQWASQYCPAAKWIVKCDSDVFWNYWELSRLLQSLNPIPDLVCAKTKHLTVCRHSSECVKRYIVKREDFPEEKFPPYCYGASYILRDAIIPAILKEVEKWKDSGKVAFWLEDVFITGIMSNATGATILDINKRFVNQPDTVKPALYDGRILFAHFYTNTDTGVFPVSELWQKTLEYERQKLKN